MCTCTAADVVRLSSEAAVCQQPMADSRRTAIAHRLFALWGKTVDLPMSHVPGALFYCWEFLLVS